MAEITRSYCDICAKPALRGGQLQVIRIQGFPDASWEQVCANCRGKIAEVVFQAFDRTALRKLGLEAPKKPAAGEPRGGSA